VIIDENILTAVNSELKLNGNSVASCPLLLFNSGIPIRWDLTSFIDTRIQPTNVHALFESLNVEMLQLNTSVCFLYSGLHWASLATTDREVHCSDHEPDIVKSILWSLTIFVKSSFKWISPKDREFPSLSLFLNFPLPLSEAIRHLCNPLTKSMKHDKLAVAQLLNNVGKLYGTLNRFCGLVVRVPSYRSRGPGSIPGATWFSEKWRSCNWVHSTSWAQWRSYLKEK
jgi:hypothetical protein